MASGAASPRSAKRSRSDMEAEDQKASNPDVAAQDSDSDSSDDDFGPAPAPSTASGAPARKKRRLPHERLFVAALPSSPRYSKSLMHREPVVAAAFTPGGTTDFLLTASADGVLKFWKKRPAAEGGVEFVKEFQAHRGEIKSLAVSADGRSAATAGSDGAVRIWDVVTFDLLATLTLGDEEGRDAEVPSCVCWVHARGRSLPLLAVAVEGKPVIRIYDGRGENLKALYEVKGVHRSPVRVMAYNDRFDCVVSSDESGMVEYWRPSGDFAKPDNVFKMKSSTNLFEFKKAKSVPSSINISPNGDQFATFSFPDRQVRVFEFASGKLYRTYDESLATITDMQQVGPEASRLDPVEFGRRLAVEHEIEQHASTRSRINVAFDETGHFILYGSLVGAKVVNTYTNRVVRVYGRDEQFRPLTLSLYQGQPDRKGIVTVEMAASDNPLLQEAELRDAVLVSTGVGKVRFYMFTNDEDVSKSDRDVQNEKPRQLNSKTMNAEADKQAETGTAAVLHTTYGDIHVRLFPAAAPKAVENFVTHARNGYYNGIIFHRVIRKFMIQTGDPLGDGTGGESIWGREFEDEFSPDLRHDRPYALSMANAGPNTNASQFFITTARTPWLDNLHTIFGRAVQGLDVVHRIENTKVYKEKPEEEIKIINISVT